MARLAQQNYANISHKTVSLQHLYICAERCNARLGSIGRKVAVKMGKEGCLYDGAAAIP